MAFNSSFKLNKSNFSNIDRLNKFTDKLNVSSDPEKNTKFEFLGSRIVDVQEHLSEVSDQTTKKFNIIKENISRIQKQIDDENQKDESLLENKNHYIKLLEQKIFERFNQEAQIREEMSKKLFAVIDDRFNSLKNEISKESRNRYESIENLKSYLENDVPQLNEMIKSEQDKRVEGDEIISRKITEDIQRTQMTVQAEKKTREETEEAILEMLRMMITKTKAEIETERKAREGTEETLLALLEDTCNKLTNAGQLP